MMSSKAAPTLILHYHLRLLFGCSEHRRVGQLMPFPPQFSAAWCQSVSQQVSSPPASCAGPSSTKEDDELDTAYGTSVFHQLRNRTLCL